MYHSSFSDLLVLFAAILPNDSLLPGSMHMFKKVFKNVTEKFQIHYMCGNCKTYIGEALGNDPEVTCSTCGNHVSIKLARKNHDFFIYIPIEQQIKSFFGRFKFNY